MVLKLTPAGELEWQRTLGGSETEIATAVELTNDGGIILLANSYSDNGDLSGNYGDLDCWVVRLDASANILWQKSIGGTADDQGVSIFQTVDGGFIFGGGSTSNDNDVSGNHGGADLWVVKLSSGITGVEDAPAPESAALIVFPSPTSGFVHIVLDREATPVHAALTDVSGKMLYAKNIDPAGYLDISDLPNGAYVLAVTDSEGSRHLGKILKQ